MISTLQLRTIMPGSGDRAIMFVDALNEAMREFAIGTSQRISAFAAQIAHESGQLRYTRELADGRAYEGRLDLGNAMPGDGVRYKGRGLIQITGRTNYDRCSQALSEDFLTHPERLEEPIAASRSAAWFWKTHGLNELADADKFGAITRKINGGYNGLDDRLHFWLLARKAVGL